ncbi:hypothetical protein JCM10908_004230 [Rhodotorula pacifica]|uniref:Mif2p n=1 Tax=Rhodotorula pacifica TaxID=1495444 RepID=UPI0031750637
MAPPTPGRQRGPRPQVNNNIGEAGRTTNIAPPKGVPRDSAGHERPEAFFDSEEYAPVEEDDDSERVGNSTRRQSAPRRRAQQQDEDDAEDDKDDDNDDFGDQVRKSNQSAAKKKQQAAATSARKRQPNGRTPSAAQRGRGAERPDKYMLGDDRGRKTGITKAVTRRDEDGMEDPNDFFNSSPGAKSVATTTAGGRSTIKKASRQDYAAYRYDEDEDAGYEDGDGNDIQDEEGTSISPLTYQRQHPSGGRAPSALRHSTSATGERSVSRKGLSSPQANGVVSSASKPRGGNRRRLSSFGGEDEQDQDDYEDEQAYGQVEEQYEEEEEQEEEDDEDEEEEVRAALGAKKTTAGSAAKKLPRKSVASTSGRRSSPDYHRRDASLEAEDSPSGLMKLDRNGRPVPADRPKNKGKGRASDYEREVDVIQQEEEVQEYVEQDVYYNDDNDFGGGGDVDEEAEAAAQYNAQQYGDGGGGDSSGGEDHYDSQDYDAGAGQDDVDVQEVDEDGNPVSDEDEQMEGPSSRPYKGKGKAAAVKGGKGKRTQSQSESPQRRSAGNKQVRNRSRQNQSQQPVVTEISRKRAREAGTVDIDGVRRSNREKVPRLEYWRNERIIYERRHSGIGLKAIVRMPKDDPAPLSKAGQKKGHHGVKRSNSARAPSRGRSVKTEVPEEQGCDDMTDPDGLVWSWEGEAETTRRIAFTERMMDPKLTLDGKFAYQKIYQELDYLASGVLTIPPGGEKGLKSSKDNSYVFCCLQGSVSVTVHRTRFAIGPGGTFFVPRGNMYQIVATSNREVRLFFAQGRRVIEYADGETRPDTREDSMRFIENEELQAVPEQDEEEEEEEED